ncbi:MAG: ABC transporter permease subunit [Candidatus Omnitrophica bacterium]|nr:ABC transporter permease subunit [Candidatus Omnitrophota bacterium]
MKNILLIANMTFKEVLRNKLLNVLLLFAIVAIASTRFFTIFAPSEELKIMQDTALGIIRFIGMLITVFVTGGLLPKEIYRRTVTVILSKPVSRAQFLFGKFCGALYSIFTNIIIMSVIFFMILFIKFQALSPELNVKFQALAPELIKALLLTQAELIVLASITLCVSTIASEIFNITFGILIFLIGHLSNYIAYLADRFDSLLMKSLLLSLYTILPNFENFNVQNSVVLGGKVSWLYMAKVMAYGGFYTFVMLAIGYLFFAEREV